MKLPSITKDLLKNAPETELESPKGIILYYLNDYHYKSYEEIVKHIKEENGTNSEYGFHYVVSKEGKITQLVKDTIAIKYNGANPTYINSNLFGGTASSQCLSILIHLEEDGDTEKLDLVLVRLLAELLDKHKLAAKYVWRGMDLFTDVKEPLHYFDQFIMAKLIKEIEKFIPVVAGGTDGMESGPDEEDVDPPIGPPLPPKPEPEEIVFDEVEFVSPFSYYVKDDQTVDEYIRALFLAHMPEIDAYLAKHKPWDKDIEGAKSTETTLGELKNKEFPSKNVLQYQIGQGSPNGTCSCEKPADHLKGVHNTSATMVEPIYPDLVTPPGSTIHVAGGESSGTSQSNSDTPLTQEEFEKRQDTFNIKDFKDIEKETFGRPVNTDDPFPVDEQIKKLEEHFPKVKIDRITTDLDDTNHANSLIGAAMAKNMAMTYDIAEEISKRTEQRLVKIENNLATVMRNLFRVSSRININCVYYGGQSVYGKYQCIRCLDDKRINDGAVVSLDQCLSCTRYEPIAGQVYAILDEAGSNITKVIDDMQMAYLDEKDIAEGTRVEEYWNSPNAANVKIHPTEEPKSFSEGQWADGEEERKVKLKDLEEDSEEYKKAIEEYKNGFIMEWTTAELEMQKANIAVYENEDVDLNKPIPESNVDEIDREAFIDTRENATTYEKLEFHVDDYKFEDFGINNSSPGGSGGNTGTVVRGKIINYAKEQLGLMPDKIKYSRERRLQHNPKDEAGRTGPASDGVSYFDCSSFVDTAYLQAGITLSASTTGPQFNKCKDAAGGELFSLSEIDKAKPGDIVFFSDSHAEQEKLSRKELNDISSESIRHVAIYSGNGKVIHISNPRTNMLETTINHDKAAFCFGKPADLIAKDQMGISGSLPEQWSREFHGIDDALWATSEVVVGQANNLPSQMEKWGYKQLIIEESDKASFDPYLVAALIAVESNGDPRDDDKYAGLMQVSGGYGSTTQEGMRDNIKTGIGMYKAKMPALKNAGWIDTNTHVLLSAYNSGEGTVINSKKKAGLNLADVKIPALGDALKSYVLVNNPTWNANEKRQYATKVLRAYNILWDIDALGLPRGEMPEDVPEIKKDYLDRHRSNRTQAVKYIVVHDVGGPMQAPSCRTWFNNEKSKVSTHYVVDDDNIIEMADPKADYCWHSGDGPGTSGITNKNSIGIEMGLYPGKGVGWAPGHITGVLHQKTIDNTVALVKMLMQQHGIPKAQVVRHRDATNKDCPMQMMENNYAMWNTFKSRL